MSIKKVHINICALFTIFTLYEIVNLLINTYLTIFYCFFLFLSIGFLSGLIIYFGSPFSLTQSAVIIHFSTSVLLGSSYISLLIKLSTMALKPLAPVPRSMASFAISLMASSSNSR